MWCVSFIIIIISFFLIFLPFFSGSRKVDLFESNDATSFRLKSLLRSLQRELNFFHCDFLLVLGSLLNWGTVAVLILIGRVVKG